MALPSRWLDRTVVALGGLTRAASQTALLQEVALRFADRFDPLDRDFDGDRPSWHRAVVAAVEQLEESGLVSSRRGLRLTDAGLAQLTASRARVEREPVPTPSDGEVPPATGGDRPPAMPVAGVISAPLRTASARACAGVDGGEQIPVIVELNLQFARGPGAAFRRLTQLWRRAADGDRPARLAHDYARGALTMNQVKRLVAADAAPLSWSQRSVKRVWPDFQVRRLIDASVSTVKADAARRSFDSCGEGVVWAVVDSGIDASHPHFAGYHTLDDPSVKDLHRTFPATGEPTPSGALEDEDGHGTHVAAVIAGGLAPLAGRPGGVVVTESRYNVDNPTEPTRDRRELSDAVHRLAGMAPKAKLVSLKVLGGGGSVGGRVSRVIQALAYVREVNAENETFLRIHGVNLSLGYDFDPTWFACGRSPLCLEVDKLVRSGVVVVVAAGNSGYGTLNPSLSTVSQFGLAMTINDPGNAERAITVGSTHRQMPHAYGVSYFSSKGPTGDGRRKPDLVAPGERITSAAAGRLLAGVSLGPDEKDAAVYVEESGTSMAAPHVSGVVAAFLSVRGEFVGRPEEVKRIFVSSATPLGRDPNFEGAGLVDLMRALQSV
jgi:subtilisin family serine protease